MSYNYFDIIEEGKRDYDQFMAVAKEPERCAPSNKAWMLHDDGSFSAEVSTLSAQQPTGRPYSDPWNRQLTAKPTVHTNKEGEATYWTFEVTVDGETVKLTIWND